MLKTPVSRSLLISFLQDSMKLSVGEDAVIIAIFLLSCIAGRECLQGRPRLHLGGGSGYREVLQYSSLSITGRAFSISWEEVIADISFYWGLSG